jgi:diguanylate cyclase (GGDEF)-like protein
MRVLFVDDESAVLDGLRRALRPLRTEWDMSFHTSAREVLDLLTESGGGLVVSDWRMPGMDGMELCRQLRKLEARDPECRYYIILLTGVQEVEAAVAALDEGADEFIRKPFDWRDLAARIRVGVRILAAEEELRNANRKLAELAATDALTALLNRRKANETLEAEMSRVERGQQSLAAFLLDIDHFKKCNDDYGHAAGDTVLRVTSERLKSACRPYDSLARWGGEEFLALCPSVEPEDLRGIADRLRQSVCDNVVVLAEGQRVEVTISVGAAHVMAGSEVSGEALVQRADEALYAAKGAGRNCVRIWGASE